MCVAIYKPADKKLNYANMHKCHVKNSDGMGFSAAVDGKLVTFHELKNFEIFWKALKDYRHYPCIVHFRWATHGAETLENCHPFLLNHGSIAMAHNGIISEFCSAINVTQEKSDTALFVDKVLQPLLRKNPELLYNSAFQEVLHMAMGSSNKLVFLDAQGKFVIIEKTSGYVGVHNSWDNGIWYSNTSWKHNYGSIILANSYAGGDTTWCKEYQEDIPRECIYCGYKIARHAQIYQVGEDSCMCQLCNQSTRHRSAESVKEMAEWEKNYTKKANKAAKFCWECGININLVTIFADY